MNDYERLARYGVAMVYDTNARRGLIDLDLRQIVPGSRAAGPARTVLCAQDDNLMVHAGLERIRPGEIFCVTTPLPNVTSLMGDLLVLQAKVRGVAGLLVDGGMRDTEAIREMNVPAWSRYVRVKTAGKATSGALDVPIEIGGTTIAPGDAVVLDADGAVVVAAADVARLLDDCEAREHDEVWLRERLAAGELTLDIRNLRRFVEP